MTSWRGVKPEGIFWPDNLPRRFKHALQTGIKGFCHKASSSVFVTGKMGVLAFEIPAKIINHRRKQGNIFATEITQPLSVKWQTGVDFS
ncbi:hypothetical protein GTU79_15025 [Sodalis ligni]|uniref:hypothetical protein n=1 Tax=Sodalis ligni TaxID=2697027 RepID=UPI001BDF4FFF|nr:hypothetical protein [Sodalis ligni]QWA08867.1 hypothetical protein GTU79_15025 [Sodalis ligni]